MFRLDRFDYAEVLDEPSSPPPSATPRDVPADAAGLLTPDEHQQLAALRLAPAARWVAEYYPMEDVLADDDGTPDPVHSIASGLDYPGVGPQHAHFARVGRVRYVAEDDAAVLDAFQRLTRLEGVIPALESAHAVAHAIRLAPQMGRDERILVNLSGRGDKDVDYVAEKLGLTGEADEVVR